MNKHERTIDIARELNLRGEVCPYTFVKSKLALEDMQPNEILRIIVDHFPATENVPRSMQNEGNDVLKVAEVSDSAWEIIIRKCG